MQAYTVRQGECLSSIASSHGFGSWRSLYYAPENADFRRKRPDPNVIYPGDVLFLPDAVPKELSCSTDQLHRFLRQGTKTWLRIVVRDEHGPLAAKRYELQVWPDRLTGTTGTDGLIECQIAADVEDALLVLWMSEPPLEDSCSWTLKIGHLDPVSEITGLQARLNNLAIDCGEMDGRLGPKTRAATKAFQQRYGLNVDGIPGPQVQDRLKQIHGC